MSMVLQHRLSDADSQSEHIVHRLAGASFKLEADEIPLIVNVPGVGEVVLGLIDVEVDVNIHSGGDYSLSDVQVKCSHPPVRGRWPKGRVHVPVKSLKVDRRDKCSLYDAISKSVAKGCASMIEDRIDEMLHQI